MLADDITVVKPGNKLNDGFRRITDLFMSEKLFMLKWINAKQ